MVLVMILLMLRILFMATANQLLGRWVCQPFTSKPNVIFISDAGRDPDHPDHLSPKYFAQNHYFDHITIYDQLSKIVICPDRKGNRHNVGCEARKPDIQTDRQLRRADRHISGTDADLNRWVCGGSLADKCPCTLPHPRYNLNTTT